MTTFFYPSAIKAIDDGEIRLTGVQRVTQPQYDAFGWSPLAGDPAETYGLDLESAREVTPRWHGVSFGNGNDGVSHTWPDYYVRCAPADAYTLAAAAMLARFDDAAGRAWAAEEMTVDDGVEHTVCAMILNPPDDDVDPEDIECECGAMNAPFAEECHSCEMELPEPEDQGSWSDANGAWLLCEVFPVDDTDTDRMEYSSLADCFSADLLKLAESI